MKNKNSIVVANLFKCPKCGNTYFEDLGFANIKGFAFKGYKCINCGNEVVIDNELMGQNAIGEDKIGLKYIKTV